MKFTKPLFATDNVFASRFLFCEKDGEFRKIHHFGSNNKGALKFCKEQKAKPLYAIRIIPKYSDARLAA